MFLYFLHLEPGSRKAFFNWFSLALYRNADAVVEDVGVVEAVLVADVESSVVVAVAAAVDYVVVELKAPDLLYIAPW